MSLITFIINMKYLIIIQKNLNYLILKSLLNLSFKLFLFFYFPFMENVFKHFIEKTKYILDKYIFLFLIICALKIEMFGICVFFKPKKIYILN